MISEGGVQEIEQVLVGALQVVVRYLYTVELPESGEGGADAGGGERGEDSSGGGGRGGGKGKREGRKDKNEKNGGDVTTLQVLEREVFKAAETVPVGCTVVLVEYCVKTFKRGLKVDSTIEQLVWTHSDEPAEERTVVTEYFVRNSRRIRVGTI